MFGTIHINQLSFFTAVGNLGFASHSLSNSVSFAEYTSDSAVLDEYKEQFEALNKAIKTYQELLYRDIEMLRQAGDTFVQVDSALMK